MLAPTAYFVGVASAVVITERVLRRREVGPVTRDMVHAPDETEGDGIRRPGPARSVEG